MVDADARAACLDSIALPNGIARAGCAGHTPFCRVRRPAREDIVRTFGELYASMAGNIDTVREPGAEVVPLLFTRRAARL